VTAVDPALPTIIQGGMGIGVSSWQLARAVSQRGQLGVVSGTAIDSLLSRRLQDGDAGGHMRRALAAFPLPRVAEAVLKQNFLENGRAEGVPYRLLPMWRQTVSKTREQIAMLAAFAEVYLAKEGHGGRVGMNLLTKVQLPNLSTLYGAMLAGVDYVIMGAGIPREIPGVLDAFAEGRAAAIKFDIEGLARGESESIEFDPARHFPDQVPLLERPRFLPVIAAHSLATVLARKANGRIDGFVVEGPTAGGHNAPPRGTPEMNERGEPIYGERDVVDLDAMRELGLPFWLAGGTASPQKLQAALAAGAAGIQVGTLFAYSNESGLAPALKAQLISKVASGDVEVLTDPRASPTGFPFKVVALEGTNSQPEQYRQRERICDLGYLRVPYKRTDGRVGYRCAAEPVAAFIQKGGTLEETEGRKCLCNGLMANVGHAQLRTPAPEGALVTSGDDMSAIKRMAGTGSYSAAAVIDYLLTP
jgi:nitronate monooxygenase